MSEGRGLFAMEIIGDAMTRLQQEIFERELAEEIPGFTGYVDAWLAGRAAMALLRAAMRDPEWAWRLLSELTESDEEMQVAEAIWIRQNITFRDEVPR